MRVARAVLIVVVAALALPGVATAATFQVNTTADPVPDKTCTTAAGGCTLREAVQLAGNADTINVPAGTYTLLRGELSLFNDHIVGAGARTTAISGNNASRVFSVTGNSNSVAGVTIRNGNGAGTTASGSGGGVFIAAEGVMTISASTVSGNTASTGGGIAVAGTLGLVTSTVSGNVASTGRLSSGGGITVGSSGGAAIVNSTISGNTAVDTTTGANASQGGGIASSGGLSFNGVTIANNTAATAGGLFANVTGAAAPPTRNLANVIVGGNTGAECGGNSFTTDTTHNNVSDDTTCSFTDATDRQGFSAALGALANNGGNTNTHALLPSSPAINNGGGCASTDQRGIARPQPAGGQCDVGAYEYRQPSLRVITVVTNDEGGTRTAPDFVAHVRQNGGDVKGSPQDGSAAGTVYDLEAGGTYVVDADAMPGYTEGITGTCAANGSITLAEGQNATCTIVENDIGPRLRVITQVVNDDGGTLAPGNFTVHLTGTATNFSQSGTSTGTLYTLVAGRLYTISATLLPGYTATISGSCAANGTITLALADDLSCTITLNDVAPTLKVVTQVVNDAGGTRVPADFTARVTGTATNLSGPGSAGGTTYTLRAARQYTVSADAVAGYVPAVTGNCAANSTITLALGQNLTCTITESDTAPTLKIVTQVINDDGGALAASAFTARVTGTSTNLSAPGNTSGTTYTLVAARQYTVAADAVSGYTSTVSGNCAANGTITLQLAQNQTCTITLDDVAPVLTVITAVDGGPAQPSDFVVRIRRAATEVASGQGSGGAGTEYTLDADTYSVSADGVTGYAPAGSGACTANGAVTLALGERKTCTITNVAGASTLKVVTQVVNDNGGTRTPGSLSIHVRNAGTDVTGSPQAGSAGGTSYGVPADTYSVAAAPAPGYAMSVSGDCDGGGSVKIGLAEAKTCTVTANDVAPTLKVITTVVNDSGGTRPASGFTVHVRKGGADVGNSPKPGSSTGTTYTLSAGTYAVGSDAVTGYTTAIGGSCATNGSVTLQPGDAKTCTVKPNDNAIVRQQQLPPPVPGKNVNALPSSGTVKKKLPGTNAFVPLDEGEQIPLGTIVDVRKGRVTIVAAAGDGQTADFYGGIFKLGQTKGKNPITVLTLVEKLSCPKKNASAAAKKKKKRRLWGDGKGRFRTKGKNSAATVLGTKWLVEDRCGSTLTRVARGRVRVRDFVKKKTVIVKAGKKYVARARR